VRFKLGKWALAVWRELGETEASLCLQTACEGLMLLRDRRSPQCTVLSKSDSLEQAGAGAGRQQPHPGEMCSRGADGCSPRR